MGAHWITLYVYRDNVTCFCSLGVEYIQRVFKIFIGSKNIIANVYRIQSYFFVKGKVLSDYTNLFSPNEYEKNGKIILKFFQ